MDLSILIAPRLLLILIFIVLVDKDILVLIQWIVIRTALHLWRLVRHFFVFFLAVVTVHLWEFYRFRKLVFQVGFPDCAHSLRLNLPEIALASDWADWLISNELLWPWPVVEHTQRFKWRWSCMMLMWKLRSTKSIMIVANSSITVPDQWLWFIVSHGSKLLPFWAFKDLWGLLVGFVINSCMSGACSYAWQSFTFVNFHTSGRIVTSLAF